MTFRNLSEKAVFERYRDGAIHARPLNGLSGNFPRGIE